MFFFVVSYFTWTAWSIVEFKPVYQFGQSAAKIFNSGWLSHWDYELDMHIELIELFDRKHCGRFETVEVPTFIDGQGVDVAFGMVW